MICYMWLTTTALDNFYVDIVARIRAYNMIFGIRMCINVYMYNTCETLEHDRRRRRHEHISQGLWLLAVFVCCFFRCVCVVFVSLLRHEA